MRTLGFVLLVALATLSAASEDSKSNSQPAAAQAPAAVQTIPAQPAPNPVPFTKQVKKTVTFITIECRNNNDPQNIRYGHATGFFVSYPDPRLGPNRQFTYLVTNRHVAMCWDENRNPQEVICLCLQFNLKDGSTTKMEIPGGVQWILPADDSVDLALVPVGLDLATQDILNVPVADLATANVIASQGVIEGSKLLVTGYFYQLEGAPKMDPIIREGEVALMPDQDLPTTTGKPGKLYLGEVHIFGGNSGSPVFVDLAGMHNGALRLGYDYKLFGVISGYYYEDQEFNLQVASSIKGLTLGNSGIAMIVPASAIRDLLEDPRVKAIRDAVVAQLNHQQARNCSAPMGCGQFNADANAQLSEYGKNVTVEPQLRFAVQLKEPLDGTTDSVAATKHTPKR
jgi:hypothetical protein